MQYAIIYKLIFALTVVGLANMSFAKEPTAEKPHAQVQTKEKQAAITPAQILQRLKDGNQRFISGKMKNRDLLAQANKSSGGQYPVAVILNCMDSRTSPELVFDQGVGDIFVIRIAGNILNNDILGSMEFGTKIAGAKLIAVIGHTSCGAIRGACQEAKLGYLTALLQKIQPAMSQAIQEKGERNCANPALIDQIAKDNVLLVIKQIQKRSHVIQQLVAENKVRIVGGMQDLATGEIIFFDI